MSILLIPIPEKDYNLRQTSRFLGVTIRTVYKYIRRYPHILQQKRTSNGAHQLVPGNQIIELKNLIPCKKGGKKNRNTMMQRIEVKVKVCYIATVELDADVKTLSDLKDIIKYHHGKLDLNSDNMADTIDAVIDGCNEDYGDEFEFTLKELSEA